jgi:hypothetical protein
MGRGLSMIEVGDKLKVISSSYNDHLKFNEIYTVSFVRKSISGIISICFEGEIDGEVSWLYPDDTLFEKVESVTGIPNKIEYLGDGVYAKKDCCGFITLMTGDHNNPENIIYLESEVFRALVRFVQRPK